MITDFARRHNLPEYRIYQFNEAFYKRSISGIDGLSVWPKSLREHFKKEEKWSLLCPVREQVSDSGNTQKVLFELADGNRIETVLMRHADGRNTVCVSSQAGCPVGCLYCATGKMGFKRNLSGREIVDQVLFFARKLKKENKPVSKIVFMGMGEPMLNTVEVGKAVDVLSGTDYMGLGIRRITVSTSGYVKQLVNFIDSGYRGKLAISLHAPDQETRLKIMPVAKLFPFEDVIKAGDYYIAKTGRRLSYEYVLIKNINDRPDQAGKLAKVLKGKLVHVNFIPCNPVSGTGFGKPDKKTMLEFSGILKESGVQNTLRVTMGDGIKAACGQLSGE